MNKNVIARFLLAFVIAVIGLFNPIIHANKYVKYFSSEDDIVKDAMTGIQQLSNSAERPFTIKKIYDISENGVSITTKTFSGYRRHSYNKENGSISNYYSLINEVGSKIEFVYNRAENDHITQINKKTKRDKDKTKKIAFNAHHPKSNRQRLS